MTLISQKDIKKLLNKYNLFPSKKFGQNFLVDKEILFKIINDSDLKPADIILEIGSGIGNLTQELAKRAGKVVAIEKDPRMVEISKKTLKNYKNIEIIQGDILKLEIPKLFKNLKLKIKNYKIVANLPYYIVSPVIRRFLETEKKPKEMILMVQKEVAQRICSQPPDMNILAVSVQFYAEPKIISFVSKKSFWPQPKVDSAILKIVPHRFCVFVSRQLCERFFKIVKAGFSQPRKQILNNLSRLNFAEQNLRGQAKNPKANRLKVKEWLLKNNIQPSQRAETLSLEDWISLTKTFNSLLK